MPSATSEWIPVHYFTWYYESLIRVDVSGNKSLVLLNQYQLWDSPVWGYQRLFLVFKPETEICSGPVGVSLLSPISTPNFSNTRSNISSFSTHNTLLSLHSNYSNASLLIIALSNLWVVEIIDSLSVFAPVSLVLWPDLMWLVTPHPILQAPIPTSG